MPLPLFLSDGDGLQIVAFTSASRAVHTNVLIFIIFIYLNIQDVLGILYVCYTIRFLYMGLLCVSASILLSKGAIDSLPTLPR